MSADLLTGKVVFLTGGASGIGRACALTYAREGARVVIADCNLQMAEQTARELGSRGIALSCDVSDRESVFEAIRITLEENGAIHCVHNNAGISTPAKPLHETSEEEWDRLHHINLKSAYWTTRYAFESLRRYRGCILNTASMVGLIGQSNHAAYASTKGAMIALTRAMALDYARYGIRVNALCPTAVWTPLLEQWVSEQRHPESMRRYLDEIHALGYCPEADVVADAAVFLLSDRARFITGCALPVSGGAELGYRSTSAS